MAKKKSEKKQPKEKAKKQPAKPAKDELTDEQLNKVVGGGLPITQGAIQGAAGGAGGGTGGIRGEAAGDGPRSHDGGIEIYSK
jgi:hypothetical protein